MERALEGNDSRPARDEFGEFYRALVRLCAAVAEIHHGISARGFHQLFRQPDVRFVIDHVVAAVDQLLHLLGRRAHDGRVVVAEVADGHAARKIQNLSAVFRCEVASSSADYAQRGRPLGHGGHHFLASFIHA